MTLSEERVREIVREELDKRTPKPPGQERRLFTYSAAAAYLGIGVAKMKELGGPNGVILRVPIGGKVLFDKADLDAYIERVKAGT